MNVLSVFDNGDDDGRLGTATPDTLPRHIRLDWMFVCRAKLKVCAVSPAWTLCVSYGITCWPRLSIRKEN